MDIVSEQVTTLVRTNRAIAAHIAELTGWLRDGFTKAGDNAAVAVSIRNLTSRLVTNQRTIRDLLWRDRLERTHGL